MAKKLVKGGGTPVVWHVDDIKVSHKDPFEVTNFDQYLLTIYEGKIKVNRGKIHDYLGINVDYSEIGVVNFLMVKYLEKVLDKFTEELIGTSSTPATDHLFQVRGEDEAEFLEEDRDDILYHSVSKLLFMISQYMRDKQTAVSLLKKESNGNMVMNGGS